MCVRRIFLARDRIANNDFKFRIFSMGGLEKNRNYKKEGISVVIFFLFLGNEFSC